MTIRLMPSDPKYEQMDALAWMLAVLKNPAVHLVGFAHENSPLAWIVNSSFNDQLAETIRAVEQAQLELMDTCAISGLTPIPSVR